MKLILSIFFSIIIICGIHSQNEITIKSDIDSVQLDYENGDFYIAHRKSLLTSFRITK